jgi:acetyl-CoA acetyltransferase
VLYGLGLTGIPIINVNNNCSTGSSALFLARQAVASGQLDCVLAVGFEQMVPRDYARRHGLDASVVIRAQAMTTDTAASFEPDMRRVVGYDMTAAAAGQVYEAAGIGPEDIPVVELHDCFTANELLSYEALGLTPEGTAEKFILDGDNTYGGRVVTNPSGGLLSKGHPLGATGLAQCAELVWQLRGQAGARQVEGASVALQHNLGLGGACVVTMYEKAGA